MKRKFWLRIAKITRVTVDILFQALLRIVFVFVIVLFAIIAIFVLLIFGAKNAWYFVGEASVNALEAITRKDS